MFSFSFYAFIRLNYWMKYTTCLLYTSGLNFAPMYNFNNYFRAGLSVDAQYDESANIKDYKDVYQRQDTLQLLQLCL